MKMLNKKKISFVTLLLLCAAASSLMLGGCGVDPAPTPGSPGIVQGVAAAGAPIKGTVALKDSSVPAKIRTAVTRSDGFFFLDVKGLQPPFLLKVSSTTTGTSDQMYSLADHHGRTNVNPFSHATVAAASDDDDPHTLYDNPDPDKYRRAAGKLGPIIEQLRVVLAPLFALYATSQNPVTDEFDADHTGLDALFDDVRIKLSGGMVLVTNKRTGSAIFTGPANNLASGTFYPENMPGQPGTLNGATLYTNNCAGCHGALAPGKKGATAAEIQTAIAANTGNMGSLTNLTALEIQAIAIFLAPTSPPPAACTYTYDLWGACQSNGAQTRSLLGSSPAGCTGTPVLSQACTYVPPSPAACTYTYTAWGTCQSSSTQTRTVATSSPSGCVGIPLLSQACTYVPPVTACTSFTYSVWGACQSNNTQTRTQLTASPAGCTGGTPVLSQTCTYVPPAPVCGSCHTIPPSTGQHSFHVASQGYACSTCHGAGYSSTAVNAATHNNGTVNVVSTLNFNATTSTCGSPGCHGSRSW